MSLTEPPTKQHPEPLFDLRQWSRLGPVLRSTPDVSHCAELWIFSSLRVHLPCLGCLPDKGSLAGGGIGKPYFKAYGGNGEQWRTEYFSELHRWSARSTGRLTPGVGDVVLVDPFNVTNRALFPLGIIVEVFPGGDGHVRAARVRVNGRVFRHSTKHLYPLETDQPRAMEVQADDPVSPEDKDVWPPLGHIATRSGRNIRRPKRLDDYNTVIG